jgi:hypothetical protein
MGFVATDGIGDDGHLRRLGTCGLLVLRKYPTLLRRWYWFASNAMRFLADRGFMSGLRD